jgi:hypothetical protein
LDSFPCLAALLGSVVGELFDVLGDVSRLIGRLVSQPTELVGILDRHLTEGPGSWAVHLELSLQVQHAVAEIV